MKRNVTFILIMLCLCKLYGQNTMATALDFGYLHDNVEHYSGLDTREFTDNYSNEFVQSPGNDVFYRFQVGECSGIEISHYGSRLVDTYIFLLNESGKCIAWSSNSRDGSIAHVNCNRMKIANLPAGIYYVVSQGNNCDGFIDTIIKSTVLNVGTMSDPFTFKNEHFTEMQENQWLEESCNGMVYSFKLSIPMNVTMSSDSNSYFSLLDEYKMPHDKLNKYDIDELQYHEGFLMPGTYYVISGGFYRNQYINLTIEGTPVTSLYDGLTASIDKNYILKLTPIVSSQTANYLPLKDCMQSIQYFDDLGRPVQTVHRGANPDKHDLVTYKEYDAMDRESTTWLPVPIAGNRGAFTTLSNISSKSQAMYDGDTKAYSKSLYEASPLNRILEKYGPGQNWYPNSHSIRTDYLTNKDGNDTSGTASAFVCRQYTTTNDRTKIEIKCIGNYPASSLYVTSVKDEEGNTSYEFEDKFGQLILSRQINDGVFHDTYYIYDYYGNKRAVLPPAAVDKLLSTSQSWSDTDVNIQQLAYLYKYDNMNRCIAKKLPGMGWVYYIYDKADQLILTQDSVQRGKGVWCFSIPDALGRTVVTGTCANSFNYLADPLGAVVVSAKWAGTVGVCKGYNICNFVPISCKVLTANYYDKYDYQSLLGYTGLDYTSPSYRYGNRFTGNYKGLLTGTFVAESGSGSTTLYSAMYYDYRKRLIQVKSTNQLGGTEAEYIGYTFTGKPLVKMHVHTPGGGRAVQTEYYTYSYDHAERLTETRHRLNQGAEVVLASNTYDQLGRLSKTVRNGSADLTESFTYNIRSWVQGIKGTQFTENLTYAYNGNISKMDWTLNGQKREYVFGYDALSRLKSADYTGIGYEKYGTAYTYDKQGNMLTLQRYGKTTAGMGSGSYGLIDNFTRMAYTGNQLTNVTEMGPNVSLVESNDFKRYAPASTSSTYFYNGNGALIKDLCKGISDISYNLLSLPEQMDIKSPVAEARNTYTYTADGKKLRVVQKWNSNYSTAPTIGSAINVSSLNNTKTTEYVGNMIYEGTGSNATALKRILVDGGYIEGGVYYFYFRDHLGNNRAVVSSNGKVVQRSHYYPFGMTFAETSATDQNKQPYQYNGKELDRMHGLNLYDYSARYMEPALGRFTTMDPKAEKYYSVSPYIYCLNNPTRLIDPKGEDIIDVVRGFSHGLIGHDPSKPLSLQSYSLDMFAQKTYAQSQGFSLDRAKTDNKQYEAGYIAGEVTMFVADMFTGYVSAGRKVFSAAKEGIESLISKKGGTSLIESIPERSLTNQEAREVYNQMVKRINVNIAPTRSNAKKVVNQRNELKQAVREMMNDQVNRKKIDAKSPIQPFEYYYEKYSKQGFKGEDLYKEIMNKGTTPNKEVNKIFGIN